MFVCSRGSVIIVGDPEGRFGGILRRCEVFRGALRFQQTFVSRRVSDI